MQRRRCACQIEHIPLRLAPADAMRDRRQLREQLLRRGMLPTPECEQRARRRQADEPLPRVMIVNMREGASAQWLTSSLKFSISETTTQRAGAGTVLAKLSELMFVEALRRHIESLPSEQTGWLAGLRDRFVGKTLALIHARPAHDWTVDELAREVGLSRSALAERFTALVGVPPMQYLTKWRLQLAADMLRSSGKSVAAVAAEVGYDSESAFSRAFKREIGVGPAAWRQGLPG